MAHLLRQGVHGLRRAHPLPSLIVSPTSRTDQQKRDLSSEGRSLRKAFQNSVKEKYGAVDKSLPAVGASIEEGRLSSGSAEAPLIPAVEDDSGAEVRSQKHPPTPPRRDDSVHTSSAPMPLTPPHVNLHGLQFAPKITVIGVGGAGGNAVNNMISRNLQGVEYLIANTDAQHLATTLTDNRLQLGSSVTQGLGCGANPDAGRQAALESKDEILERIDGSHMVFVCAGLGGGTGTGAAPVIADIALGAGLLTVAVVTKPFHFEGKHRMRLCDEGLSYLKDCCDCSIVIPNQHLFKLADERTSLLDAFRLADDVLLGGVRSVTDLMVNPGHVNLDFADVQAIMAGMGNAMMGTGEAEGDDRAIRAAEDALSNPLLGDLSCASAKGVLVNVTGGADITLMEVDKAVTRITGEVQDPCANIIFGSAYDPSLEGRMRVSVLATGIDSHPPSSEASQ